MKKIVVNAGDVLIGNGERVVVQTMCNTSTLDIEKSVEQCRSLSAAGAALIRLTTQGIREVEALGEIKRELIGMGVSTPLIADVHFSSKVAEA
ncbi:MAG: flavodoxin-dependent (E)-4-hydroxy-3-methylbut-2-enyl-diphosphate synthase, partial [Bacteroidales bacterium]|nr:flavodoxin-dependent (E)-4-hydroxy-3-methylbut-2-enyl-diphosphate synthase [Bacteroidales bacterium]